MSKKINELLQIVEKSEKSLNDMVDWHIASFQEPDESKRKLYRTIYESKRKKYCELMKELLK